jgi:type II secretory pathway component PulL
MEGAHAMTRRLVALLLLSAAVVILAVGVPSAHRERDAARLAHRAARAEREQLRVRLANLDRRTSEDRQPTAATGAAAVRALRSAVLAATDGLEVTGVEVTTVAAARGAVAAQGRLAVEGDFVEVLRLTRRLASSASGVLLERVTLGEARGRVRLEAEAFILKETP